MRIKVNEYEITSTIVYHFQRNWKYFAERYSFKLQTICTHDFWKTKSPACHITAPVHITFCVHPVNSASAAKNQNNNATVYVFTKPKKYVGLVLKTVKMNWSRIGGRNKVKRNIQGGPKWFDTFWRLSILRLFSFRNLHIILTSAAILRILTWIVF